MNWTGLGVILTIHIFADPYRFVHSGRSSSGVGEVFLAGRTTLHKLTTHKTHPTKEHKHTLLYPSVSCVNSAEVTGEDDGAGVAAAA